MEKRFDLFLMDGFCRTRRGDRIRMAVHKLPLAVDEFIQAGHSHMEFCERFTAANIGTIIFNFYDACHLVIAYFAIKSTVAVPSNSTPSLPGIQP